MPYLILIGISLLLFVGFLSLTAVETRRGVRILLPLRESLDTFATRLLYIVTHIDLGTFTARVAKDTSSHIVHALAHSSLVGTRFIERTLTRAVRYLRTRHLPASPAVPKETSGFVRTIIYFKQTLRRSRKSEVPPTSVSSEDTIG